MITSQASMTFAFPMKPVRVDAGILDRIDTSAYIMEAKYDGFRAVMTKDNGIIKLWSRQKNSLAIPQNLKASLQQLDIPDGTTLDGELWNMEKRGGWNHSTADVCRLTFWDAMFVGGENLTQAPIEVRKNRLASIIGNITEDVTVAKTLPARKDLVEALRTQAMQHKVATSSKTGFIHGAVLKRIGSPRRDHATRSVEHPDWLKLVWWT